MDKRDELRKKALTDLEDSEVLVESVLVETNYCPSISLLRQK